MLCIFAFFTSFESFTRKHIAIRGTEESQDWERHNIDKPERILIHYCNENDTAIHAASENSEYLVCISRIRDPLSPSATFNRRHTYLFGRILIACTSSLASASRHSLLMLPFTLSRRFSPRNPAKSAATAETLIARRPRLRPRCCSCRRSCLSMSSYISPALPRDPLGIHSQKHTFTHRRTYSHSRSTPTGTSTTTGRESPLLSLGPGVEASIRRRRRLRATPDPPFPIRAFSRRIRGCDPAVATHVCESRLVDSREFVSRCHGDFSELVKRASGRDRWTMEIVASVVLASSIALSRMSHGCLSILDFVSSMFLLCCT